jgi:putative PIN family toxin of toxin-antitoxin system
VKVVFDTNVFISGVFFTGPPHTILKAWRDGLIRLIVSAEILEEYRRVGELLALKFSGVELEPFLALVAVESEVILAPALEESICEDSVLRY